VYSLSCSDKFCPAQAERHGFLPGATFAFVALPATFTYSISSWVSSSPSKSVWYTFTVRKHFDVVVRKTRATSSSGARRAWATQPRVRHLRGTNATTGSIPNLFATACSFSTRSCSGTGRTGRSGELRTDIGCDGLSWHVTVGTAAKRCPSKRHSSTALDIFAEMLRVPVTSMSASTGKSCRQGYRGVWVLLLQPLIIGKQSVFTRCPLTRIHSRRSPLYKSSKSVGCKCRLNLQCSSISVFL